MADAWAGLSSASGSHAGEDGGGWQDLSDAEVSAASDAEPAMGLEARAEPWGHLSSECVSSHSSDAGGEAPERHLEPEPMRPAAEEHDISEDEHLHHLGNVVIPQQCGLLRLAQVLKPIKETVDAKRIGLARFAPLRYVEGLEPEVPSEDGCARIAASDEPDSPGRTPLADMSDGEDGALLIPHLGIRATRGYGEKCGYLATASEQASHIVRKLSAHPTPPFVPTAGETAALQFLFESKMTMQSERSAAASASTTQWTLKRMRRMAACSAYLINIRDSICMLDHMAGYYKEVGGRCICLIEKWKGDKTSLTFAVSDVEAIGIKDSDAKGQLAIPGVLSAKAKQAAPTKILQTHREVVALFQTHAGEYICVRCYLPVPLQVMSSTKQEVYFRCFEHTQLPLTDLR